MRIPSRLRRELDIDQRQSAPLLRPILEMTIERSLRNFGQQLVQLQSGGPLLTHDIQNDLHPYRMQEQIGFILFQMDYRLSFIIIKNDYIIKYDNIFRLKGCQADGVIRLAGKTVETPL